MSDEKVDKYLSSRYYDPNFPASFTAIDKFYEEIVKDGKYKLKKAYVEKWLQKQDAYTLHKPIKRKFKRSKFPQNDIDELWAADLKDLIQYEKYNEDYKYLLVVMDIFSRFIWTKPLRTKSRNETKISIVERVIQTLFRKVFRYFTAKQTYNWMDVIGSITQMTLNAFQTSIQRIPSLARPHQ